MGGLYSLIFGEEHPPNEVTDVQQAKGSISPESSPANSVNEGNLSLIQDGDVTQRTDAIFPSPVKPDHIDDVDKKNIYVICAGKSKEFFTFPLENISVLLEEACDWARKKPQNMKLVFEGVELDAMKTVSEYPRLRRGSKVNLIRAS
ncbi:hypothetical protein AOLI_G00106920 [Acnodon oligacanthus]